jgi:hypothetical protein
MIALIADLNRLGKDGSMLLRAVFIGVIFFFHASSALANPVSCERLIARQVPETRDVQITWIESCSSEDVRVSKFTKDGSALHPDWIAFSGYSANMGSGVSKMDSIQTCDYDVKVGEHKYVIEMTGYEDE